MDATTILQKAKAGYVFQNIKEARVFNIGFADAGLAGIKAIGTHDMVDLSKGEAVVGGRLIMLEPVTSAGAATMKIQVDAEDLTSALAIADMVAGEVVDFDLTAGKGSYAAAADVTVDMVIAVAAITAGRFIMQLDVIDVNSLITRG